MKAASSSLDARAGALGIGDGASRAPPPTRLKATRRGGVVKAASLIVRSGAAACALPPPHTRLKATGRGGVLKTTSRLNTRAGAEGLAFCLKMRGGLEKMLDMSKDGGRA